MTVQATPHFHNQPGVTQIRIHAGQFMCVGALPPFDHPHIYIDMGDGNDAICPYCSTHYVFDPKLDYGTASPAECVFVTGGAENSP